MTAVYDGDTIKVRLSAGKEEVVRLIGVDCPEIGDEREDRRFKALMAKRFTFYHLFRKNVSLEYDWEYRDKHNRVLAFVFIHNELFNEFILQSGFAWLYLRYPFKNEYRLRLIQASRQARHEKRGLWKEEPYPVLSLGELKNHFGQLVRVEFVCVSSEKRGKYYYLYSRGNSFSALIPLDELLLFPESESAKGRKIIATGFLEDYCGLPQILLFLPNQLEVED